MNASKDIYPSRGKDVGEMFPRKDPVIHSRNQSRWEGPLDEFSLSRYERDGYLWFEGFFARERIHPIFEELRQMAADEELIVDKRSHEDLLVHTIAVKITKMNRSQPGVTVMP